MQHVFLTILYAVLSLLGKTHRINCGLDLCRWYLISLAKAIPGGSRESGNLLLLYIYKLNSIEINLIRVLLHYWRAYSKSH